MMQWLTVRQLKDKDPRRREAAARKLGSPGNGSAVEPLIAALPDSDERVRLAAADALATIGDARAAAALVPWLSDPGGDERWNKAARVLKMLGWTPTSPTERVMSAAALDEWDSLVAMGPAAVEPLGSLLKDAKDSPARRRTISVLQQIGGPKAAAALASGLGTYSSRTPCAEALIELGDEGLAELVGRLNRTFGDCAAALADVPVDTLRLARALVPHLVSGFADAEGRTRKDVAKTLSGIDPRWMFSSEARAGMATLIERLAGASAHGLNEAMGTLGKIDPQWAKSSEARAALPAIIVAFTQIDDSGAQGWRLQPLANVFGEIGDASSIEPLVRKLPGNVYGVSKEFRVSALKALRKIDRQWAATPAARPALEWAMTSLTDSNVETDTLVEILVAFAPGSVEPLLRALESNSRHAQEVAVKALGEIGDKRAVDPLHQLLQKPPDSRFVRDEAARALRKFPNAGARVEEALQAHALLLEQEKEEEARNKEERARRAEERQQRGGSKVCPRCDAALQWWSRSMISQTFGSGGGGSRPGDFGGVCKSCRDGFCAQHARGGKCPACGSVLA